jgi:alpha-L-arabinofuranosidase
MVLGTWYAGLKAAGYLMEWQKYGEFVDFVCFNNLSNTHGQAVFESAREATTLTGPGMIYELISRTPARRTLKISNYDPGRKDMVKAQASWSLNRDTLVIFALNRTDTTVHMSFDLSKLAENFSEAEFSMLDADDIFCRNKAEFPDEIRHKDWSVRVRRNTLPYTLAPRSFTQVILPVK